MLQDIDTAGYSAKTTQFDHAAPRNIPERSAPARTVSAKRLIDIVGALAALLFFAPLMSIIYVILMFSGGGPVFAHRRVGQNGVLFSCYKFRSMVKNADAVLANHLRQNPGARAEWESSCKLARDPRVTWFGMLLRRSSMDELPQFINVLRGDMSLVGPRPIVPDEVERYSGWIRAYYQCKPGITGLWQVSGRNDVAYDRRVRLDAVYARKKSVGLDAIILIRTVRAVLSGRGAR